MFIKIRSILWQLKSSLLEELQPKVLLAALLPPVMLTLILGSFLISNSYALNSSASNKYVPRTIVPFLAVPLTTMPVTAPVFKANSQASFLQVEKAASKGRLLKSNNEFISDNVFISDKAATHYEPPTTNINNKDDLIGFSTSAHISASKLGPINLFKQINTQSLITRERDELMVKDTEAALELQEPQWQSLASLSQGTDIIGLFAVSGPSSEFLSVAVNGRISLWNLKSGKEKVLFSEGPAIAACDFHASSKLLAISQDSGVVLYDVSLSRRLKQSPSLGTKAAALEFAPDGKSLLVGGEDGKVYRWRLQNDLNIETVSKIEIERYIGHSAAVTALAYHPFSRMFFSADSFGSLAAWLTYDKDLFGGKYDERANQTTYYAEDGPRGVTSVAEATTVLSLRISKDGQNVFSALQDGRVEWRLVRGLQLVVVSKTNKGAIYDMQVSPSGKLLATVARDGVVRVWKPIPLAKAGEVPEGRKSVSEINDFKKNSLGYLSLVKEFPLEAARKLLFLSDSTLVVGESSGRLLELSL